jgi:alginate O-acetyltransferase complex protein AlgI
VVGLAGNVLLLGGFKYVGFVSQDPLHRPPTLLGAVTWAAPSGLSFYTFTQIGYLIDAYAGGDAEKNPIRYALFVAFFPYVTAGPIVRYEGVRDQFTAPTFGQVNAERLAKGLTLIAVGLVQKLVLAANMASLADPVFSAGAIGVRLPWWEAVVGAVAYSFQIYFDFAGYSDMAVGLGLLFGLALPWNFNAPYQALNPADFWQRWHISLSTWLRTYLFTPISFSLSRVTQSQTFLRVRLSTWAYTVATLVTMLVCGLWHGAGWTFIAWGLLHGCYLVVHQLWSSVGRTLAHRRQPKAPARSAEGRLPPAAALWRTWLSRGLTFAAVTAAWVVFRAPNLGVAGRIWWALLGGNGGFVPGQFSRLVAITRWLPAPAAAFVLSPSSLLLKSHTPADLVTWLALAALCVWGLPSTREWMKSTSLGPAGSGSASGAKQPGWLRWAPTWAWSLAIAVIALIALMHMAQLAQFLYFQF